MCGCQESTRTNKHSHHGDHSVGLKKKWKHYITQLTDSWVWRTLYPTTEKPAHNSGLLFCRCDKTLAKSSLGREGRINLYLTILIIEGSQARNPKAGTKAETTESTAYWLAFCGQDRLAAPPIVCGMSTPKTTNQQEDAPRANLMEARPQLRSLLSKVTLVYVKLTITNQLTHPCLLLLCSW